jgi:hypothetical protein
MQYALWVTQHVSLKKKIYLKITAFHKKKDRFKVFLKMYL